MGFVIEWTQLAFNCVFPTPAQRVCAVPTRNVAVASTRSGCGMEVTSLILKSRFVVVAQRVTAFCAARLISAQDNSLLVAGTIWAVIKTPDARPHAVSKSGALTANRAAKVRGSRASPLTSSRNSGGV